MSDNTIFCRECNAQNKAGNKFCSNCGASLKPATHITCPSCYHRNPLNLLYCDNCGTRLVREGPTDDDPASGDDTQPLNVPTGFSLPSRNPGDTADLDPDSLPDWLKTGGNESNAAAEDDWLGDLKESSTSSLEGGFMALDDDFGDVNLDWMADDEAEEEEEEEDALDFLEDEEPLETAAPQPPEDDFTLTGIIDPSGSGNDFDWLSVMGDTEPDDEPTESPPTGFTGLLSPEMLSAFENANFENANDEPTETTSEEIAELGDWLADQSADDDSFLAFDDDEDEEADESDDNETTGFTDWLHETTVDADVEPAKNEEVPDWLSPPEEAEPQAAAAGDDWLNEFDDDSDADDDDFDSDDDDEALPDWLETPATGPLSGGGEQEESIGTGFTGWLNAQHVDDFLAEQEKGQPQQDAAAGEEFPDWLDTPETGPLSQNEPISTGFTNLLDSSLVDQFEEEAGWDAQDEEPAPAAQSPADDVPDWLSSPPEDEDEGAGTGFTDWLTQSGDANEAEDDDFDEVEDDDDFDWLDEEKTQELMKPLTTEEAQKLLENTPDVSDDFIKEVVGGDFPEWLTDVETVEDPGDTGVLPAWISAPVSDSDTLTLGLGRDMPLSIGEDDDWLADLAGPKQNKEDNDWFSELATTTAAADEDFFASSDDDEEESDEDFFDEPDSSADDEFGDDLFAEPSTAAAEPAGNDAWLGDLPALEDDPLAEGGDSWMAGMPGLEETSPASTTASDDDDWMVGMPDMDNTGEILDDVFGDMAGAASTGGDDWLSDMPQEEEQDTVGWMSSFGDLESKATASLDWMDDSAAEEEEEEDDFEPLGEEESEEPRDPTFIDPVLDYENFEAISEDTNAGELDWLSVIESTSSDGMDNEAGDDEDPDAWLQGSDLDQEESGSYILDENLHAVVFKEEEEEDEEGSYLDDTDTLGDNWEVDLLAPITEDDNDIMQELRALRSTDRLDPAVVEAVRQDEEDPEIAEFISNREDRASLPRTAPDWITDGDDTLTNWVVDPFEQEEPAVQQGGPLDGLSGVVTIAPVMAVAPVITRTTAATRLNVSAEHQQHANLLRQLARGNWEAPPPTAVKEAQPTAASRSNLLLRLALGLLLMVTIVVGMLMPNLLPTSALPTTPELRQVNSVLNELNNQVVLVAFEYSPSFAGELNPQAQLFLNELAQNGNRMVLMSQYPTGLANARPILTDFNDLAINEIGYIPGEALGLREIATCLNQPSCQTASGQTLELSQVDAIVVLTGERDSLINWVEQVEPRTTKPLLLGVTEALAPLAQPYVVSKQVDGLIAGLPAAASYEQAYQTEGSGDRLFQTQTLARILAVAVIIIGAGVALLPKKSADTE